MLCLHSFLQLRGSAQAVGNSPIGVHSPPDDAGFSHVNDLYKTALDDNEVIPVSLPWKIWWELKSSSLVVQLHYCQIKIHQYSLFTIIINIHVEILHQTAKFTSVCVLAKAIWNQS